MFVDDLSEVKSCVVVAPLVLDRTLVVAAVRLVRLLQVKRDEKKGAGATFDWLFFDNSKLIDFDC
jgi:hypothetical protein